MKSANHVLIAGASGVIGTAAVEHFSAMRGWSVTALSRRAPEVSPDIRFDRVELDLTNAEAVRRGVAGLSPVTHLIYAAVSEAPGLVHGWKDPEMIALNGEMFANLLEPLAATGHLRHVSLLQGAKAYGAHVHEVHVPLRESEPRDEHPNFYWLHEDKLRNLARAQRFSFTIWRPQVLLGWAPGAAMNPVAAIGAYAALCKELGRDFLLPGSSEAIWEMVDADLLADGFAWATMASEAQMQTFNITNGDQFVLRHDWQAIAEQLGFGEGATMSDCPAPDGFEAFFGDQVIAQAWTELANRHGLREKSLARLIGQSDRYLDLLLGSTISDKTAPVLLSTVKLRQAGFGECRNSLDSVLLHLRKMEQMKLLPPLLAG